MPDLYFSGKIINKIYFDGKLDNIVTFDGQLCSRLSFDGLIYSDYSFDYTLLSLSPIIDSNLMVSTSEYNPKPLGVTPIN